MSPPARVLLIALPALAGLAFLVDRALLYLERRGHITWRRLRFHTTTSPDRTTGLGNVLSSLQELVEPQHRHIRDDQDERAAARADAPRDDDRT